jgi:hypothetical protein
MNRDMKNIKPGRNAMARKNHAITGGLTSMVGKK